MAIAQGADQGDEQQGTGQLDGDQVVGVERFAQAGDVRLGHAGMSSRAGPSAERRGDDLDDVVTAPVEWFETGRIAPGRESSGTSSVARAVHRPVGSGASTCKSDQSDAEEQERSSSRSPGTASAPRGRRRLGLPSGRA